MGSLTLVLNMVFAPLLVSESVSFQDVLVNFLVMSGTLIAVFFGPHDTPAYDLQDLMGLVGEPTFIMYQSLFGIWLLSLLVVWQDLGTNINYPHYLDSLDLATRQRLLRFSYPAMAGSIGGLTAAYAKASIELIKTSIVGENQFVYFQTYGVIFLMVFSVICQIKFLNAGLERYEAMYIVPVYQVFWIMSGVLAGMFYFHEIDRLSEGQIRLFSLGAGISITGIILHSYRSQNNENNSGTNKEDMDKDIEMEGESIGKSPLHRQYKVVLPHNYTADTDTSTDDEEEYNDPCSPNTRLLSSQHPGYT